MPDPNYIRIKRSNTATNVPSSLESGELAANVVDQKLWIGASNTTPVLISDILGTFTNKGSWDYYSAYQVNNVVEYAGVFYFAKSSVPPYNTQPNINTTYWSPFSNPSGGGITLNDISSTMTGLDYNNTTGVFSATSDYSIPQTSAQTNWDSAYNNRITSLTTTGSSGSATLVSNTLNIPTYTLSGLEGQASSTNLTSLSGLTYAATSFVKMTASGTFGLDTNTYLTANQSITLSGDVSGTGSTAITVTLSTVGATKGGTGQTTYTLGDILYCSASNVLSKLSGNITTAKQFLTQTGTGTVSAAPAWASLSSADVTTALGFTPASPGGNSGEFQYKNASGGFSGTSALQFQATAFEDIRVYGTSSSRVPFSVDAPPSMTVNIFEITSQQTIPYITINNLGAFSVLQNDIIGCGNLIFKNSVNNRTITLARPSTFTASYTLTLPTSAGTNGQVLLSGGGASPLQWGNSVSNLNGGDGFTLKGSIPYQSDVNTTTLLSPNTTTTRKFLRQTGTGTNGAAPAWDTLTSSDIGLGNVENTAISTWAGSTNITTVGAVTTRNLAVVPVASTGSPSPSVTVTAPAHTALTASTESNDLNINLARTAQFATGALTTQRAVRIQPPTYSAVGASVITNASTVSIDNPPAAGSNVTITNPAALNVGTSNGVGIIISGVQNQSYDLFRANITNIDSTTSISTTRSAITISSGGQLVLNPTNSGVGNTNQLRFLELAANGTNYVGFKGADNIASNVIWTLPSADGTSGQVLSTNGSGTLSWATASSGSSIPSGSMQMYAGSVTQSASSGVVTTNAPSGWLLCNGDIVSRTTYSALFTAIGTTYGAGDGSTTFALPDMRGRVPIGVGQGAGLTNRTLASTTGVESITLSSSNIPSLTTGSESANHTHSGTTGGVSANHYHQNFSDGVGSGNMGRAQYGFSGLGGGYAGVLIVGSGQNNYSTSYTGYISSDHNHTFSTGFASSGHTHTYTNSSPTSINNMQPSISINFIIKI